MLQNLIVQLWSVLIFNQLSQTEDRLLQAGVESCALSPEAQHGVVLNCARKPSPLGREILAMQEQPQILVAMHEAWQPTEYSCQMKTYGHTVLQTRAQGCTPAFEHYFPITTVHLHGLQHGARGGLK